MNVDAMANAARTVGPAIRIRSCKARIVKRQAAVSIVLHGHSLHDHDSVPACPISSYSSLAIVDLIGE